MEIVRRHTPGHLVLELRGRLDATWSDFAHSAVEEAVRAGARRVGLDLAAVPYMSSAGIRVLVQGYKHLSGIGGAFFVVAASEQVRSVLELSGLDDLLSPVTAQVETDAAPVAERTTDHAAWRLHGSTGGSPGTLRLTGSSARFDDGLFTADCGWSRERLGGDLWAIGVGALGRDFIDLRERCGELLAAGGVTVTQPAGGAQRVDFLVAEQDLVPEVVLLSGLVAEGGTVQFGQFAPRAEGGAVDLAGLAADLLAFSGTPAVAITIVGESRGLVGATLLRSPVAEHPGNGRLSFPEIRRWLSFTHEPAWPTASVLIVGVATRLPEGALRSALHPLDDTRRLWGHFHAVAVPYRPIGDGFLELPETVHPLFDAGGALGVLHLVADNRPLVGAGRSRLARGAAWFRSLNP